MARCWCLRVRTHRGKLFHRPLGGHVEFGECALDTVHREFREEIGQALTAVALAGVLENIFERGDATQHEIVFRLRCCRG